jgi:hypothetical protein
MNKGYFIHTFAAVEPLVILFFILAHFLFNSIEQA